MNHAEMYGELQVFTLSLPYLVFFCLDNTADDGNDMGEEILVIRHVGRSNIHKPKIITQPTTVHSIPAIWHYFVKLYIAPKLRHFVANLPLFDT